MAKVEIEGRDPAEIGHGLLVYVAIEKTDSSAHVEECTKCIASWKLFPDDRGKLARNLVETMGSILIVPSFTLTGEGRRGHRMNFLAAADLEKTGVHFEALCDGLRQLGVNVTSVALQQYMRVLSMNEGPVVVVYRTLPAGDQLQT